jgi:hypothetical protein
VKHFMQKEEDTFSEVLDFHLKTGAASDSAITSFSSRCQLASKYIVMSLAYLQLCDFICACLSKKIFYDTRLFLFIIMKGVSFFPSTRTTSITALLRCSCSVGVQSVLITSRGPDDVHAWKLINLKPL